MPWYWWVIIVLSLTVAGLSILLYTWQKATQTVFDYVIGSWLKGIFGKGS